jgi:hypothetical protein
MPGGRAVAAVVLAAAMAAGFAVDTEFTVEPLHESAGDGLMENPRGSTMKTRLKALRVAAVSASAAVSFAVTESAQAQQPAAVQWRVEDGGNGHWYSIQTSGFPTNTPGNWNHLNARAVGLGAALCSIESVPENDHVRSLVTAYNPINGFWCYLGGVQELAVPCGPLSWSWNDGTPWVFNTWQPGQPDCLQGSRNAYDEPRMAIRSFSGQWGDWNDRELNHAVIEWSADCNNDGIVDYGQCRDGSLPDFDADNVPDCCERNEPCTVGYYPRQWRVEDGGNGHWYELVISGPLTWGAARDRAEMRGGYLATPTSPAENAFIIPLANHPEAWVEDCCGNTGGPWLGGYQPIGASPQDPWRWVTGEPWDWAGWAPGEPNNGFQPGILVTAMLGYPPLNQNFRGWADGFADGTSPDYPIQFPLDVSFIAEYSADCNNDGIVDYGQILLGELTDLDANGIPDTCEVVSCNDADLTQNGTVDGADLGAILAFWGPTGQVLPQADINRDGQVNGADIGLLLSFWGPCGG